MNVRAANIIAVMANIMKNTQYACSTEHGCSETKAGHMARLCLALTA